MLNRICRVAVFESAVSLGMMLYARTTSLCVIVGSALISAFFYFETLTPYWNWEAIVVPTIPFALLVVAFLRGHPSKLVPAICALSVMFAGIAAFYHFMGLHYHRPQDPDADSDWLPVAIFILPVELVLAGAMLLGVHFERAKRL